MQSCDRVMKKTGQKATRSASTRKSATGTKRGAGKGNTKKAASGATKKGSKTAIKHEAAKAIVLPEIPLEDPWKRLRSPYGGRASPADEYDVLKGHSGRWLTVDRQETLLILLEDRQELKNGAFGRCRQRAMQNLIRGAESEKEGDEVLVCETNEFTSERISLCSCDILEISLTREEENSVVALNLTDNRMSSASLSRLNGAFLRELVVAGNALSDGFPDLSYLKFLVKLDLSYNTLSTCSDDNAVKTFQSCNRIRELNLQACHISGPMFEGLVHLSTVLEVLDISSNLISNKDEFIELQGLRRISSLSIQNNPALTSSEKTDFLFDWCRKFAMKFGALRSFNGAPYTHSMHALDMKDVVSGETLGAGDDSSSCSCIEGNPCAVSYNCKNWANRFEVARQARENPKS